MQSKPLQSPSQLNHVARSLNSFGVSVQAIGTGLLAAMGVIKMMEQFHINQGVERPLLRRNKGIGRPLIDKVHF